MTGAIIGAIVWYSGNYTQEKLVPIEQEGLCKEKMGDELIHLRKNFSDGKNNIVSSVTFEYTRSKVVYSDEIVVGSDFAEKVMLFCQNI